MKLLSRPAATEYLHTDALAQEFLVTSSRVQRDSQHNAACVVARAELPRSHQRGQGLAARTLEYCYSHQQCHRRQCHHHQHTQQQCHRQQRHRQNRHRQNRCRQKRHLQKRRLQKHPNPQRERHHPAPLHLQQEGEAGLWQLLQLDELGQRDSPTSPSQGC